MGPVVVSNRLIEVDDVGEGAGEGKAKGPLGTSTLIGGRGRPSKISVLMLGISAISTWLGKGGSLGPAGLLAYLWKEGRFSFRPGSVLMTGGFWETIVCTVLLRSDIPGRRGPMREHTWPFVSLRAGMGGGRLLSGMERTHWRFCSTDAAADRVACPPGCSGSFFTMGAGGRSF